MNFLEWLENMWLVLLMSMLGGCAYAAKNRERTLLGWACCIIVGTFSGIVTYMAVSEVAALSDMLKVAISSASSASGGMMLDLVLERVAETAGKFIDSKQKDKSE